MRFALLWAAIFLATSTTAKAEDVPKGWFLHDDLAPNLTLAYYDPTSGNVDISVTCDEGYADTVIAFYPDSVLSNIKQAMKLVLSNDTASVEIDANGQTYNNRYTVSGIVPMDKTLAGLLEGSFTVSLDGRNQSSFGTTESGAEHVRRLTKACSP